MARRLGSALALLALSLTGCGGGSMGNLLGGSEEAPKSTMAGRWLLQAPRAPACGMEFGQAADGLSGRVSPEGGCPAAFYKGRRWVLEGATLTIRDDNGDTVGQFSQAGDRFDGKSSTGMTLTLTRPAPPPTE